MAMRMPPQVAQQTALPDINRSSLVLFGGFVLILLNFYWQNGNALYTAIFSKGAGQIDFVGYTDFGWQILGLALLTLMAEYGGEGAGSAALLFVGALWLLWLLTHMGTRPASEARPTNTGIEKPTGERKAPGGVE